jgi:hypothetical protein
MNATERNGLRKVDQAVSKATEAAQDGRKAAVRLAGEAEEAVRGLKDRAEDEVDAARETLSQVGERLAATLRTASDAAGDALPSSRVFDTVADGVSSVSQALRQRSVGELASDVKTLAQKHPGAFMAAAAVLGFAAASYMRASSRRRLAERETDTGRRA